MLEISAPEYLPLRRDTTLLSKKRFSESETFLGKWV